MAERVPDATVHLDDVHRQYYAEMSALTRRLLAEEGVPESVLGAEDVVQSAFAKALRAPESIREARAYLYAVIRNDVRAAGRRNRARAEASATRAGHAQALGEVHVADFSDLIANRMAVYKALDCLPSSQRTAVWATKALDYTQAETAEVMGKAPGTVATHVLRAVAAIRANLVAVLAAIVSGLVIASGRILQVVPASGGDRDLEPQELSDDGLIYLAGALLLGLALAACGFRAWRRRRWEFNDSGTFAQQPVAERIRAELEQWWWKTKVGRSSPRRRVRDDTTEYARTRTRLPDP
ncbi:RNA polymerase sigma factor [Streptomyces brasiliscabiei]|uniref:RNA polymerase sigma factor n=1 Tax=Streptomyces brasiliscabiei TaxID=2736302 RepID=UPI001C0F6BD1|nr:RNA polymerase sigma factor [Streptomyces brasiliscabiei]